jgi:ubiquinone/menaquinone biosynthesis C-methylase UbiE
MAAFTAAYQRAAAAGSGTVSDADVGGLNIDHVAMAKRALSKPAEDPTAPLRDRVAKRLAESAIAAASSGSTPVVIKCVELGCSAGGDLVRLDRELGMKDTASNGEVQLYGLDLLEAQLVEARKALPAGEFAQGDVEKLPYEESEFDTLYASRLLIHVPSLSGVIDEMLRVMKPGALGILCEGDMEVGMRLLTTDDRLRDVFDKKNAFVRSLGSNKQAASDSYRYLLSHTDATDVAIEAFSAMLDGPVHLYNDPELTVERQFLQKLVDTGSITAEDMDYYLAEATGKSAREGNFLLALMMFEVSFRKAGA